MLIRTQDKKTIFDMSGCTVSINIENEVYGFGNNSPNEDPPTILGYYSTEERAIEVLDEICENYQYIKVGETVGVGMSEPQYVFQMPEV